jgi:hypothetical protein
MNAVTSNTLAKPVSVAFLLGASDAEAGEAFAPEMYLVRHCDKVQYAVGFELTRGASEATRQFTHSVNWGGQVQA